MVAQETMDSLKTAIVTLLTNRQQIGMDCDLSCYQTHDDLFFVEYFLNPKTVGELTLTDVERRTLADDEELIEIFMTAEEAADFYLRLTGGRLSIVTPNVGKEKKRTLKEKVTAHDKDKYF
jgi:hypothetical protein